MSKVRTPGQVFDDLTSIRIALPGLLLEYRRAYDYANSPGGGAGGESGRAGDIAYSDATGDVALAKGASRGKVRRAGEDIADALSRLNAAASALHRAFPRDVDGYQQVLRMPPMVTRAEISESKEAQKRREVRGDL